MKIVNKNYNISSKTFTRLRASGFYFTHLHGFTGVTGDPSHRRRWLMPAFHSLPSGHHFSFGKEPCPILSPCIQLRLISDPGMESAEPIPTATIINSLPTPKTHQWDTVTALWLEITEKENSLTNLVAIIKERKKRQSETWPSNLITWIQPYLKSNGPGLLLHMSLYMFFFFFLVQSRFTWISATCQQNGPEHLPLHLNVNFWNLSWPEIGQSFMKCLLCSRHCDKHRDSAWAGRACPLPSWSWL